MARSFALSRDADSLRARIIRRVDDMFARGLVAETEHLLHHGLAGNRIACQALGYRQVIDYLQGQRSLPDTIALVKTRTWQFARRQMSWFRNHGQFQWLDLRPDQSPEQTAQAMAQSYKKHAENDCSHPCPPA
jgi:tRNA dimethylallyltransferase